MRLRRGSGGAEAKVGWGEGGGERDGLVGVDGGDDGLLEVGREGGDVGGHSGDVIFIWDPIHGEELVDECRDNILQSGGWIKVRVGGEEGRAKKRREGLDVLFRRRREAGGSDGMR